MRKAALLSFTLLAALSRIQAQDLPASYDLRSIAESGSTTAWISGIQDQGVFSDCWSFATAEAANSNLLMQGLLTSGSTPPPIQVSSWELSTSNGAPESLLGPDYGGSGTASWGGNEYQALGYLSRGYGTWAIPFVPTVHSATDYITEMGGGVVLNSEDPKNPFPAVFDENIAPDHINDLIPPTAQPVAYATKQMTFLDQGFGNNVALPAPVSPGSTDYVFTQGAADLQVQAVKSAIQAHGAVTTSMNAEYDDFHYIQNSGTDTYTVNYINKSEDITTANHEVTIIGWSDTYQITDPSTGVTTTGAWLVQNSWGTSYWTNPNVADQNNGTFWVSYNDPIIGRAGVSNVIMTSQTPYNQVVLQNELGPLTASSNYPSGSNILGMAIDSHKTFASLLTSPTAGQLAAIGLTAALAGATVEISIYAGWDNGPTGHSLLDQTFTFDAIGYQLITLDQLIDLTADEPIVIELTYDEDGVATVVIGDDGLNDTKGGYLDPAHGLSYYKDDFGAWKDFADESYESYADYQNADGGVLFLKGFTAVPEPGTIALLLTGAAGIAAFRRKRRTA